jgi:mRNA-degrading endonuclease toxin of MazEF toxin-antitoxin module
VPIPDGAGGLRGDGIAVCHQLTTLDRAKLTRRLGQLPPDVLAAVEDGMRAALDLA